MAWKRKIIRQHSRRDRLHAVAAIVVERCRRQSSARAPVRRGSSASYTNPPRNPHSPSFDAAVILGYWLTNVLGFVLMHKGAQQVLSKEAKKYSRRDLLKDVIVSLLYTALIVVLLKTGILKPISAYFSKQRSGISTDKRRVNRLHRLLRLWRGQ